MSSESGTAHGKRTATASNIFHRISSVSASMRSRGSSMLSKYQREMMGFSESEKIRWRDWLFALVELLLAFSYRCFVTRENSQETQERRGQGPREQIMETLFYLGFASFANMAIGQIMDSFTGYYFMALLNIIIHFSMASFYLITEIIHQTSSEDVYVYAMDQVGIGKGASFVTHYTFIFNLFSFTGPFLFMIVADTAPSSTILSAIAFCFNGTVLFLYAYVFRPRSHISTAPAGAAIKVWGVLITALRNKRKLRGKVKRQELLDYAENKYDKAQIARSRRIFRLFLMTSPTTGFLLFTTYQAIIFKELYDGLKFTGDNVPKFMKWLLPTSSLIVVIIVEYAVLPLLRACKCKVNFLRRFFLGYISMLLAVTFAGIITSVSEKLPTRPNSGTLRVYNTMEGNVTFELMQYSMQAHFNVFQKNYFRANFDANEQVLFRMSVAFMSPTVGDEMIGNTTNYTQLFSVTPEEVLQYVAIAPSTIIRVPGFLPIHQGPPGKNNGGQPRCFIASLIGDREQVLYVVDHKKQSYKEYIVGPGNVEVFQTEEGNYTFRYAASTSQKTTSMLIEAGGLYGIYLFLGLNEYEVHVDEIVPGNTNHPLLGLAVSIPMGIAKVFGQVSLDAFIYFTAPDGLKGLAYGFYLLCIHLSAWFLLLGFHTWHHYITPDIILIYAFLALVSFVLCLAILIRFRQHYVM